MNVQPSGSILSEPPTAITIYFHPPSLVIFLCEPHGLYRFFAFDFLLSIFRINKTKTFGVDCILCTITM